MIDNDDLLPICVLIVTKNEEKNITRCLQSVRGFSYVAVIDSHSTDRTTAIARDMGAEVISYQWNGQYPKKRQWCLDTLFLPHDWVLWLDADEELTDEAIAEIKSLFQGGEPEASGYFIRGRYVVGGRALKYGMQNNKIALMNKRLMQFPVVDDLDIAGMGEMEGHYQPVLKAGAPKGAIGQLRCSILHYAFDDRTAWTERHERYARWEAGMIKKNALPDDPVRLRRCMKRVLRDPCLRGVALFFYSYVFKAGFLEGKAGRDIALSRLRYCFLISTFLSEL